MLYKLTQSLQNFKEIPFLGAPKVRSWSTFTLTMPYLGQNLAHSESCPIPRLLLEAIPAIHIICQRMAMFEQLNDQLLMNSK